MDDVAATTIEDDQRMLLPEDLKNAALLFIKHNMKITGGLICLAALLCAAVVLQVQAVRKSQHCWLALHACATCHQVGWGCVSVLPRHCYV
jgi:hypothetical protein